MTKLLSIHIPKTAGTSFYNILSQVYPDVSPSYRRKDIKKLIGDGSLVEELSGYQVIHGHINYSEVADLHKMNGYKVITWMRHPVDRVISNFNFFKAGLRNPERNREQYQLNRHRSKESLLTYAQMSENRNRMSKILHGIELEQMYFIGFVENFESSLGKLAKAEKWGTYATLKLNVTAGDEESIDQEQRELIAEINEYDMLLYQEARRLFG